MAIKAMQKILDGGWQISLKKRVKGQQGFWIIFWRPLESEIERQNSREGGTQVVTGKKKAKKKRLSESFSFFFSILLVAVHFGFKGYTFLCNHIFDPSFYEWKIV